MNYWEEMTVWSRKSAPHGQQEPVDNAESFRLGLPAEVADEILAAHRRLRWSYRAAAEAIGTDVAHYWRITRGERCPSPVVAERIIDRLDLNAPTAEALREAASQTSSAARLTP